jgi:hypothetical protein
MAFLMLYGSGWTQRWPIPVGSEAEVRAAIRAVGTASTGEVRILDPGSGSETTLVVSWTLVAAAVVLDGRAGSDADSAGQYA